MDIRSTLNTLTNNATFVKDRLFSGFNDLQNRAQQATQNAVTDVGNFAKDVATGKKFLFDPLGKVAAKASPLLGSAPGFGEAYGVPKEEQWASVARANPTETAMNTVMGLTGDVGLVDDIGKGVKAIKVITNSPIEKEVIVKAMPGDIYPIIAEAKKYNSAEDFIKAKQTPREYRSAHQLNLSNSITADKVNVPALKEAIRTRNGYLNNFSLSDLKKLEKLQNTPEAEVKIYRASPKNELNDGDWVTTDKIYANDIKKQNGGKVYSYTVKVKDLRFPKDLESLPSTSMASVFSYSPETSQLADIWNKANAKPQ